MAIFCDWCSGRDIDPVRVTVQQLADFLVYIFEIKRLVPSTIKGYRSAIGRTISTTPITEDCPLGFIHDPCRLSDRL
jgi:hypothetical protein